jgi:putative ABC transport system permease protein
MNGVSGAPMSIKLADFLAKLPHVAVVAPVISNFSMTGSIEILYGIDYKSYDALKPFTMLEGRPFQGPYDVIVDDVFAHAAPVHRVGDSITILNHPFRICGIVESGKGGRKLIPIDTMGQLIGSDGKASVFYLKADSMANEQLIIDEIHSTHGLENYRVQTMSEVISLWTPSHLPGFDLALKVVISIAVIVGFLVIFQSMYTAVLERTREIGILKSLGASKMTIVTVVLRETGLLSIAGVILGICSTFGVRGVLALKFPTFNFELTAIWMVYGALIAFAGSICGALYPAFLAARKDPIDALAYE